MHSQDDRVKVASETWKIINKTDERDVWMHLMTRKMNDSSLLATKLCCDTMMAERFKTMPVHTVPNGDGAHHEKHLS